MGATMTALEGRVKKEDRALFVVITDGHENASTEWSHDAVQAKVEELTEKGNWTVVYLASTPDAVQIGESLGSGVLRQRFDRQRRGRNKHHGRALCASQ